jgi:hypothetical protein
MAVRCVAMDIWTLYTEISRSLLMQCCRYRQAITCHVYKHKNMIASRYDIHRSCADIIWHAAMQTELRDETWKHNNIALEAIVRALPSDS